MGLGVVVGMLADLDRDDPDEVEWVHAQLAAIGAVMTDAGLQPHRESEDCDVWWAEGHGYSGLRALLEVAGHVWKGLPVPRDRQLTGHEGTPLADELRETAQPFLTAEPGSGPAPASLANGKRPPDFLHLVCHSTSLGHYVPTDFPLPLFPTFLEDLEEEMPDIWPLGSAQRLKAELAALAEALEIPDDLTSQDDEIREAIDDPDAGGAPWMAQPIATYSLLILREACEASLKTGAAVCFC